VNGERPTLGLLERAPLLSIVWDHGAMGRWVSPVSARLGTGTWLGPSGRYRFDALIRLAGTHRCLIWRALIPGQRDQERVSP
jgi:hypothetical protein